MTVPLKTRVLLADDHPVVRRGLRDVLDAEADFQVVAEVDDGASAVSRALEDDVDLAILDARCRDSQGFKPLPSWHSVARTCVC